MERAFKGIWISSELWLKKDLTLIEKVFLVEISSLDGVAGCYARNDYFANFFDLSKSRCSTIINTLKKKGYIIINYIYKEDRKTVERRVIKVNENMLTKKSVKKNENMKQVNESIDLEELGIIETERVEGTLLGLCEESLGQTNRVARTSREIEKTEKTEKIEKIEETAGTGCEGEIEDIREKSGALGSVETREVSCGEVIDYLNEKCHKKYRLTTGKTQKLINARVREGFFIDDFKDVIDRKSKSWLGCSMEKYLRPETLFGTKFESYLNENSNNDDNSIWNKDINSFDDDNNNSSREGGQTCGKQYKTFRNDREDKKNTEVKQQSEWLKGCDRASSILTDEDREWAERELF
ncbi:conserved phage C-terminal domain-containing protein [Clostridium gasigenes]|uniref:conserved phage C-terminal domain-containing protein n=1 Tax=Clostridium gasigenes TaxID=94869 RepID=UPI0033927A14